MRVEAHFKYAKQSPQKVRLVADQIRGLPVEKALLILKFSKKKAANLVAKTLRSAIANAEHNDRLEVDELHVSSIYVNKGPTAKRMRARAKGRSVRILKPTSHITVIVADNEEYV